MNVQINNDVERRLGDLSTEYANSVPALIE